MKRRTLLFTGIVALLIIGIALFFFFQPHNKAKSVITSPSAVTMASRSFGSVLIPKLSEAFFCRFLMTDARTGSTFFPMKR